jgi:hypothetical protein
MVTAGGAADGVTAGLQWTAGHSCHTVGTAVTLLAQLEADFAGLISRPRHLQC